MGRVRLDTRYSRRSSKLTPARRFKLTWQRLNINYFVARSFYHVCSPLVGIKLEVEGEEHLSALVSGREGKGQSAVLVGNHQR